MAIPVDDFIRFCERTIDLMTVAIARLDDATVNEAPDLPGANTPFRIVTHALAACEWWTAHMICGHASQRDRAAEFAATGSTADLVVAAEASKIRLRAIAPELEAADAVVGTPRTNVPLVGAWTVGAAMFHAYEELAQHLGQLDITVDLLLARR